jgi:putative membrane protein
MIGFLLRVSINLLALVVAGSLINGIRIESLEMGVIAACILSVVNAIIRPVVLLLTLGLFTLVVNAAMLMLVSALVPGFLIESFRPAFFGAIVISLISWGVNIFISNNGKFIFIKRESRGGR